MLSFGRGVKMQKPLADRIRPERIEDVVGQQHLLDEGKVLRRIISTGLITSMVFYGPPGTGKTTVANIIAKIANKRFYKLNATHSSVKDIQEIIGELDTLSSMNGVILYLDEIQNFNKKQQQTLLDYMENGKITLIASTTENPYFYVYKAILSRATVYEFKPLDKGDIFVAVKRAFKILEKDFEETKILCDDSVFDYFSASGNGDVRKAINNLELAVYATKPNSKGIVDINMETAKECTQRKVIDYDKYGDSHYDILSAFQKSIRGSDINASLHYLARMIKAEDLTSICRRLLVIASEDIGMAYPNAICIVKSCVDSAIQIGFPEARINLAQAVITLATAPKSNSVITAIDSAISDIEIQEISDIPQHLKDSHYDGAKKLYRGKEYKYPHNYNNNFVKQQYLPESIKDAIYYTPGKNKIEDNISKYWKTIID
jgi:putative ATPase